MEKKFEVVGNVSIVATGKTVVSKESFETVVDNAIKGPEVGAGNTLTDMYDRFSKLFYVIDASGSMGEGMLSDESVKMYKWTADILEQFKAKMRADKDLVEELFEGEFDEDDEAEEEMKELMGETGPEHINVDGMSEDELKMYIVSENLSRKYKIDLDINYNNRSRGRSKMMALKDAAKEFVHQRFQKYADARVGVFQFEDSPQLLVSAGASEEEVMTAINRLPDNGGGGTNIYRAVERVVNECNKRPSEVGLHHIVLVSDGCDYGGVQVKELVPKMKELGIVFDFIYMLGLSEDAQGGQVAEAMRWVCEMTGGEYTVVKTEQDFIQKFLTVSNRPMLPAPK